MVTGPNLMLILTRVRSGHWPFSDAVVHLLVLSNCRKEGRAYVVGGREVPGTLAAYRAASRETFRSKERIGRVSSLHRLQSC